MSSRLLLINERHDDANTSSKKPVLKAWRANEGRVTQLAGRCLTPCCVPMHPKHNRYTVCDVCWDGMLGT